MWLLNALSGRVLAWVAALVVAGVPQQAMLVSALPLRLAGVRIDRDAPSRSACLIGCGYAEEKPRSFSTGQTACDVAEIKEIRQDGVVVRNLLTSRSELLTFSRSVPVAGAQPAFPSPVVNATPDAVAVDLAKGAVDQYLENLPVLLDSATAAPRYRESGGGQRVIEGFEIGRIREAGVVEQLGLRNGDVLLEVNGQPLDGLGTVIRLVGQLQSMPQVKVTVLRNGQKVTFVFNRK